MIVRFNRTIKEKMFKYFSANNTRKCVDVLDLLVDQFNNAIHSSIQMTPKETSRKENENKVSRNLYLKLGDKTMPPIFSMGDNDEIANKKKTFVKGYTQNERRSFFKISQIQLIIPLTYKITDYNGEEIQGSLYEQELQKTKQDIFRIDKIIKQQGNESHVK